MTAFDGAALLTTNAVAPILAGAVRERGGSLRTWRLDHVDADPGRCTTATYQLEVERHSQVRRQTMGLTVRAAGPNTADRLGFIIDHAGHQLAGWFFPHDPDLPGLARILDSTRLARLLQDYDIAPWASPDSVRADLIGYRPRRRAVFKVDIGGVGTALNERGLTVYVKAIRQSQFDAVVHRHRILNASGVPSPQVLAVTDDRLLVIAETPGMPLTKAIFADQTVLPAGRQIIDLLDAFPPTVAALERRPPWTDSVRHYVRIVETALPELGRRLDRLANRIEQGLAALPLGNEATHGDFYEAQVFVAGGSITGVIDIDTIGPGRRADDLACLVAHLNCIQRMNAAQEARVVSLLGLWLNDFDGRVDPVELRLRAAGVIISLATGPYRSQDRDWQRETTAMVARAEHLVSQAQELARR